MRRAVLRIGGTVVAGAVLSACASVPHAELDRYLSSFAAAKSATEDVILTAQIYAEKSDDGTNEGKEKLRQRSQALEARLAAVDLIARYNEALTRLASGASAPAIKSSLEGLSQDLSSFSIERLSALVGDATPFIGVISQAIAQIDNAIRAERFAEAVAAAQKPILEIVSILKKDADSIHIIHEQYLEKTRDQEFSRLAGLRFRLGALVNDLKEDDDVRGAIKSYNAAAENFRGGSSRRLGLVAYSPIRDPRPSTAEDRALLHTLVTQAGAHVAAFNATGEKIAAHEKLVAEYKNTLSAMQSAFTQINGAIQARRTVTGVSFAANLLDLRKAYLQIQEARQ